GRWLAAHQTTTRPIAAETRRPPWRSVRAGWARISAPTRGVCHFAALGAKQTSIDGCPTIVWSESKHPWVTFPAGCTEHQQHLSWSDAPAELIPKLRFVGSGIEYLSVSLRRLAMDPDGLRIEITRWPRLVLEMTESVDAANQRRAVDLSDSLFH